MSADKLEEWKKHRRQSLQALPVGLGCLVVFCVGWWGLNQLIDIPSWVNIVMVGFAAFGPVGDAINIAYLTNKLRRVGRNPNEPEARGGS